MVYKKRWSSFILFFLSFPVVSYIYLLRGGGLAGTNGPHRLIGEHDLAPVLHIVCERDV